MIQTIVSILDLLNPYIDIRPVIAIILVASLVKPLWQNLHTSNLGAILMTNSQKKVNKFLREIWLIILITCYISINGLFLDHFDIKGIKVFEIIFSSIVLFYLILYIESSFNKTEVEYFFKHKSTDILILLFIVTYSVYTGFKIFNFDYYRTQRILLFYNSTTTMNIESYISFLKFILCILAAISFRILLHPFRLISARYKTKFQLTIAGKKWYLKETLPNNIMILVSADDQNIIKIVNQDFINSHDIKVEK